MNSKARIKTALVFQNTKFEVVDQDGETWLRSPQIGEALGFKNPSQAIDNLYKRNAAEFTGAMTNVIDLPTAGGVQKTRIFSLRGAHLLGMLASTAIAVEFRRWILDILDGYRAPLETGRMSYTQRLAYLKERRSLVIELAGCKEHSLAGELYENLRHVSMLLGITPAILRELAPGLKQGTLTLEGGAT